MISSSTKKNGILPVVKKVLPWAVSGIAVLSLGLNGWLAWELKAAKQDPQAQAQQEDAVTLEHVRRLMVLPDEMPTIATVTEPEKLKNQSFFEHAKTGDKVLVFTNAKKAVLYDPVADKIIEVAPLNFTQPDAAAPEPAPAPEPDAKKNP